MNHRLGRHTSRFIQVCHGHLTAALVLCSRLWLFFLFGVRRSFFRRSFFNQTRSMHRFGRHPVVTVRHSRGTAAGGVGSPGGLERLIDEQFLQILAMLLPIRQLYQWDFSQHLGNLGSFFVHLGRRIKSTVVPDVGLHTHTVVLVFSEECKPCRHHI